VEKDCAKPVARISGNSVNVYLPVGNDITSEPVQEYISKVVTEVYRMEAKTYLPQRTKELAQQFGFKFNEVSVRNNHSNWGSCSSKNNISLNINLMKVPDHLIDYIILHELSHTLVKNHGKEFYWVLDRVTGNRARELAKEIKKFSTYS
jgi:predicted metal-dependent hydrolase